MAARKTVRTFLCAIVDIQDSPRRLCWAINEENDLLVIPDLIRLTYVSTLHPEISLTDMDALVAKAAVFNQDRDITGVLAVDDKRVCQILEGPRQHVEQLFRSIRKDRRHHTVTEIETRGIDASSFENWGMVRRDMVDMVIYALD
ncbi:BLUF domain-containing protein [Mesorhizobium sp.]|uniref:BLUF domain-containing protein n=1 Tax=Mesorhizobium sp. TaxID=1871066 RepID=UPI002DDCFCF3|nr:BLUF domain-containing protein [Mesorhizobium sp.]